MPKLPVSNTIPVLKAHSIGQLSKIAKDFPATSKRASVDLTARRRALLNAKSPKAYTVKDRAALLKKAGLEFNPPTGDVHLSVRYPYAEGFSLYFPNVDEYDTDQDRVGLFMMSKPGDGLFSFPSGSFFSVIFHADSQGARYLLDISVSGAPNLTLTKASGGASATADSKGHVLMVVVAGSGAEASITLMVDGPGMYNFHNVVVSRI
jgi:hypothetical protein